MKLELDTWRSLYKELQTKHTARLENIFKEQKQREEEIRQKYEEDKSLSQKGVSKASFVIMTDMKNLLYLFKHQNIENVYEMVNTEINEKDIASDQFICIYKEFKTALFNIFKSISTEKHINKEHHTLVQSLRVEKEKLEKELFTLKQSIDIGPSHDQEKIQELHEEYASKIEEMEQKNYKLESQVKELKGIDEKFEKIKLERLELERQISSEARIRERLEEEVETLRSLKNETETQLNLLKQQLQQRDYIVKTKQTEIDKLSDNLLRSNDKVRVLEDSLDKLKEKYGEENSFDYHELQHELEDLSKRLNMKIHENEEITRSYEMRINQMEKVIQESQKVIDLESKKTETITSHHTELVEEVDRLKNLLLESGVVIKNSRDYRTIVDKTVEFVSVRSHHFSSVARELEMSKKRLEDSENDRIIIKKELEAIIQGLEHKLSDDTRLREEEKYKFETIIKSLEDQLVQKREFSNEVIMEQTKRLNRNMERLQIDLAEKDKQLQSATNTIRSLREESDIGVAARDERIRQLEDNLAKKDEEISKASMDFNKDIDHLKKKIKKLQADNDSLHMRVENERSSMAKEAQSAALQLEDAYTGKLRDYEIKFEALNSQLSQYHDQISDLEDRINSLIREKEELIRRDSNSSVEKILDEQLRQLQDHYESDNRKYLEQYEHMVKKYKILKERFFKQSLRQNELQNYLLKLKRKHKRKKEGGEDQEQDTDPAIQTTDTTIKQTSNILSMPSMITSNSNLYSNTPIMNSNIMNEGRHVISPNTHQQQNTYYDYNNYQSHPLNNDEHIYPKYIVAHPPPPSTTLHTTSSPSVHHSDHMPHNNQLPSYYQPISAVSITKKASQLATASQKILNTAPLTNPNSTTTTATTKKKKKSNTSTSKTRSSSNPKR